MAPKRAQRVCGGCSLACGSVDSMGGAMAGYERESLEVFYLVIVEVMYFSVCGDRKVPKERHAMKGPTVPSFRIHPPAVRALFRFAECLCAVRSQFAG